MNASEAPTSPAAKKISMVKPLVFLAVLVGIVFLVRFFQLDQYLEKERLRHFVASYGYWGPIIYLAIWTFGPPLSLPGLPITLAGGVLFGPFWGVVYCLFGATAGASLAFLVARYMARDWIAHKLAGTKLNHLDDKVARHGWKIVALTRVVPIFPYVILNFAFGLTRISLKAFALSTFIFMLPLTLFFVYFSSNILDLFQGEISREFIIGAILVVLAALVPWVYKKYKASRGESLDL